eukprot:287699-Pleurochrysis_carterae.AAC.1
MDATRYEAARTLVVTNAEGCENKIWCSRAGCFALCREGASALVPHPSATRDESGVQHTRPAVRFEITMARRALAIGVRASSVCVSRCVS